MRVADVIFERLRQETDCVYVVAGGGAMFLLDALGRSGLRYVPAIFEQGAGLMALGHAMASGKLGVVLTTSGPGFTNSITAIAAAWMDSISLLVMVGQARSDTLARPGMRTYGVQECNIVSVASPISKYVAEPMNPTDAIEALETAIRECTTGRRGPSVLAVPQDIQGAEYA